MDPELLLWVQATLIVTSVEAYRRWVRPLAATEKEQFWQEARRVGVRLGDRARPEPTGLAGTAGLLVVDARRPTARSR